jgi:tRNA A-37 threonylcarbamoyl transferase component Bud32
MFLSYGGRPVVRAVGELNKSARNEVIAALGRLYQYGVLHCDAKPHNVLYDERTRKYMVVDLMLAEMHGRRSLKPISMNNQNRKRKWSSEKHKRDPFIVEMHNLRASLLK